MRYETNKVFLNGEIVQSAKFSHETHGEKFYLFKMEIGRLSETKDTIQVIVSDRLIDVSELTETSLVDVVGEFRSYNLADGEKRRVMLTVFAKEISIGFVLVHTNNISLDGCICRQPVFRTTPSGREITDFCLAVHRSSGKSDYIPCICWGRDAEYVSNLPTGTKLSASGRIQSRQYEKKISETESETRVAYEVSVKVVKEMEEKK